MTAFHVQGLSNSSRTDWMERRRPIYSRVANLSLDHGILLGSDFSMAHPMLQDHTSVCLFVVRSSPDMRLVTYIPRPLLAVYTQNWYLGNYPNRYRNHKHWYQALEVTLNMPILSFHVYLEIIFHSQFLTTLPRNTIFLSKPLHSVAVMYHIGGWKDICERTESPTSRIVICFILWLISSHRASKGGECYNEHRC